MPVAQLEPAVPPPLPPTVPVVPHGVATFLGFSPEGWTAIGTIGLGAITLALVVAAIYQVRQIRAENKKIQTLTICCGYDTSSVIHESLRKLRDARDSGDLEKNPRAYRTDVGVVLNYLDSIAIGIQHGLFLESLVWDHMEFIVKAHVKMYIDSGLVDRCGLGAEYYTRLIDLRDKWSRAKPSFHK